MSDSSSAPVRSRSDICGLVRSSGRENWFAKRDLLQNRFGSMRPINSMRPVNMPWAVDEILSATVLPPPGHSLDRWLVFGAGLATTALRRWSADARLRGTAFAGVLAGQKGLGAGVRAWFESRCVFDPG